MPGELNKTDASVTAVGVSASTRADPSAPSIASTSHANAKNPGIRVSTAVLDASRKGGEDLLRSLRTITEGLAQKEAGDRLRTTGPNEVAQEQLQGWPVRLLKIIRNPLVILLATLSGVSFATGDARAGIVMAAKEPSIAGMVLLFHVTGQLGSVKVDFAQVP